MDKDVTPPTNNRQTKPVIGILVQINATVLQSNHSPAKRTIKTPKDAEKPVVDNIKLRTEASLFDQESKLAFNRYGKCFSMER